MGADVKSRISENKLEMYYKGYLMGLPLSDDKIALLIDSGYLDKPKNYEEIVSDVEEAKEAKRKTFWDVKAYEGVKSKEERLSDLIVDVLKSNGSDDGLGEKLENIFNEEDLIPTEILTLEEYREKQEHALYRGGKIEKSHWSFTEDEKHDLPVEFVRWINSINLSFSKKINFPKFNLYRQQSQDWIAENKTFSDYYEDYELLKEYTKSEILRIRENTLYGVDKYGFVKDEIKQSGKRKIKAYECQEVILYLIDCGFSLCILKPRQIGFTTIFGLGGIFKVITTKSHFSKYICESEDKGEEIFNEKFLPILFELPEELIPSILNDSKRELAFGLKDAKGSRRGLNSKIFVSRPYDQAINGGSPGRVYIDEIGNIKILRDMVSQARAALYQYIPERNRLELTRQIIMWGTGGDMEAAGREIEIFFRSILANWEEGIYSDRIIPIFLDAHAKPGFNMDFYEKQKIFYYSKDADGEVKNRTIFHQTYPLCLDDVFMTSSNTFVPEGVIMDTISDINTRVAKKHLEIRRGIMVPIYDTSRPIPAPEGVDTKNYIPYIIKGAKFIETSEYEDSYTVEVYEEPENYINRYYKGTDPVITKDGQSYFCSSVWDKVNNRVVAHMRYKGDLPFLYMQSFLLNMYYGGAQKGIKELVEQNTGEDYMNFMRRNGLGSFLVPNRMLPKQYQSNKGKEGLYKHTSVTNYLYNDLRMLTDIFRPNIPVLQFWYEMKHYVKKSTKSGVESFGPKDKNRNRDDSIDSVLFSYIAASCYVSHTPINNEKKTEEEKLKNNSILVMDKASWTIRRGIKRNSHLNRKKLNQNGTWS